MTPHQVLDAFYSGGGARAWGLRFSIGNGGQIPGDEPGPDTSNLNIGVSGGYSVQGRLAMDIGAKIHSNSWCNKCSNFK